MLTLRTNRKRSFKDNFLINQIKTSKKILQPPIKNEEKTDEQKLSDIVDEGHEVIEPVSNQTLDRVQIKEPQFKNFTESGDSKIITELSQGVKTSENSVDLNLVPPKCDHNHIDENIVIHKNGSGIYPNYQQNLITKTNKKNDIYQVYKKELDYGFSPKIKKNKKIKKSISDFY